MVKLGMEGNQEAIVAWLLKTVTYQEDSQSTVQRLWRQE
jgi:hypothetical protein